MPEDIKNALLELQQACQKALDAIAAASDPDPGSDLEKEIELHEVRAVLAEKSRAGHTEQVRELIKKHGGDRLSNVDKREYPALLKEAEAL